MQKKSLPPVVPIPVQNFYIKKVVHSATPDELEQISLWFCEKTIQSNPVLIHFNQLAHLFEDVVKTFKRWSRKKNPNLFPSNVLESFFSKTMEVFYSCEAYIEKAPTQAMRTIYHVFGRCFWIIREFELVEP